MLFLVVDQLFSSPVYAVITLAVFVLTIIFALSAHEFSHALSAYWLGDNTAKNDGRLTLNPKVHIDPVGGLMLLIVGFGWARPTPINPFYFSGNPKTGTALVSLAGPISNVLLATIAALPFRLGIVNTVTVGFQQFNGNNLFDYTISSLIFWNLLIAAFNLLPIAPLDGFKIAVGLLPRKIAYDLAKLERHGPVILLLLIASSWFFGFSIIGIVIKPLINVLSLLVLGHNLW